MRAIRLTATIVITGLLTVAAFSQSGVTRRIEQPRDPALEMTAKHNLEVARYYITKRKAYKGALDRLLEITDTYPDFSRMDEVLLLIGEANLKLDKPDDAANAFKKLLKDFRDSELAQKARERLEEMKVPIDEPKK